MFLFYRLVRVAERERGRDRKTERETDRQTDRQRHERQRQRETQRQTGGVEVGAYPVVCASLITMYYFLYSNTNKLE